MELNDELCEKFFKEKLKGVYDLDEWYDAKTAEDKLFIAIAQKLNREEEAWDVLLRR